MSIQTFLGPILAGTQKNNNAAVVTSNTPSATFLQAGTGGSYRNTGANDCFQFITIPAAQWATAGTAFIPYYTVSGVNYPVVIPAGSYIDNIDLVVTTTFPATTFGLNVNLVNASGTVTTIATVSNSSSTPTPAGIYATANTGSTASQYAPLVYSSNTGVITNTGASDSLIQLQFTTAVPASGAFGLAFNYVLRSPDGSWYPQTPLNPYSQPSPATY